MVHVSDDCNFALKVDWDEAAIIHETGTWSSKAASWCRVDMCLRLDQADNRGIPGSCGITILPTLLLLLLMLLLQGLCNLSPSYQHSPILQTYSLESATLEVPRWWNHVGGTTSVLAFYSDLDTFDYKDNASIISKMAALSAGADRSYLLQPLWWLHL